VRRSAGGIGKVLDAIRDIAGVVGFEQVRTNVSQYPKVRLESTFVNGNRMRIKIEMNTFERSTARPTTSRILSVDSPWFTDHANVSTFTLEELTATKIRALFQRKKGRDLFDIWLTVKQAGVLPPDIAACFGPYRPTGWNENRALANLDAKLEDQDFTQDLSLLLPDWPAGYTVHAGAEVAKSIIQAIASNEWRDKR